MGSKRKDAFLKAYLKFKEKQDWKFSIQVYHNDESSEPFHSLEANVERIILDYIEDHDFVVGIHTNESTYSFASDNWLAHVDDHYVSFGSTHNDKTYCIIEFC